MKSRLLPMVAAAGLLVAGCSATPASTQADSEPPDLQWSSCPDGVENPETGPARLQCATVPVPLDYDDPDGETIDLTISRLPSKNPDARRGSLMLNPGGPGGTGLDQPIFLSEREIPQELLDTYDLIGMDTRGIGHSSPISCGFTPDVEYYGAVPPYAFDEAAFDQQANTAEEVATRCAANDDGRTQHVTTANMARDLDRIRAALGDDKGNFLGYSYGTALGAAYASMFPDTSDRIVLDSNIGDTHLDQDGMRRYGLGMEDTFPDFAKWAAARNDQYGLGSTPEEVRDTYFAIADKLDRTSVEGTDGRLFRLSTFVTLYNPASYESAAQSWIAFRDGTPDDAPLAVGAAASQMDNNWSVFLAVTCNDVEWPSDPAAYEQAVEEDRRKNPLFGAAAANIMPCAYWQIEQTEPPVQVENDGPTNVLVAQHQRDPVTPLRGGELIHEKFGDRSRFLSVDGSGHGVYALGKNTCAQDVITDYLVDGIMPEQDMTCPAP
ncbi:alpha/beta fold hydrolase [Rhodococcus sp. BP-252]|uniref:Hydrolase n=1 Tax=Rhodococcoides kyotonense TaxID=398843 RepID=A0A177YGX0_9NOCA|nr:MULTISPECIES: alpha/beta hydrolase [Rhodococcus]MBY6412309.1 alpha/beta fold hydrolase [Rhodococcus sp. BP-320]MBY6416889.1 alpha/beta fold hydrolase [Rhodococcus sp. BP-321]MBY6421573.1 alpha/beta fold hydrolase [Rhodococcus sp. BP-324]MBY6426839.1 alpha/beta fold hydrolase [Rhodococcus sp. BP-323]MBY6432005.1 alpha/beta fold hydrolase [Rhodococcus sp. BP-322]